VGVTVLCGCVGRVLVMLLHCASVEWLLRSTTVCTSLCNTASLSLHYRRVYSVPRGEVRVAAGSTAARRIRPHQHTRIISSSIHRLSGSVDSMRAQHTLHYLS